MPLPTGRRPHSRWQQHDPLSANLFAHPLPADIAAQLDPMILDVSHPSWLRALSVRPELAAGTWVALWHRDAALRDGLCARPLTAAQLDTIIASADGTADADGTVGDAGADGHALPPPDPGHAGKHLGAAVNANPHLLEPARLTRIVALAGTVGRHAQTAVASTVTSGALPATADTIDLLDRAAQVAGPLERARMAACAADLYPLERLERIAGDAARLHRSRRLNAASNHTLSELTHVTLARRPDLCNRLRRHIDADAYTAEETTWLATLLSDATDTRKLLGVGASDGEILQMGHGRLLTLVATRAQGVSATYTCRRLHTPTPILRYGRLLTGTLTCTQRDCWGMGSAEAASGPVANVGILRTHLADFENALLSGVEPQHACAALTRPELTALLTQAATRLGARIAGWELLCWLVDTVDADTPLADLPELASSL
jgi:hypothetical protein